jgi:serine acetyltransferase
MLGVLTTLLFIPEELEKLRLDLARRFAKYPNTSRWWRARYYWGRPQYRTLLCYRLAHAARHRLVRRLFQHLYARASARSGVEILTPSLGGGVIMPHHGRTIINAVHIGRNFYVLHGVSIGNDYRTGLPTIGDNVFVGVGSIVLGRITIGDNAVIGAGSVVLRDVPANSLAAGNPARVIKRLAAGFPTTTAR